jgi:crotonobetainyl-CoA:carnitine CoA-transferase CaiB-like acyl-CoA transferase
MSRPRALENIRVVDFSWVRAGPWATRWLGALGAEIIKIEWPENERGRLPSTTTPQNLEINLNTSGNFNDTNVNKKSLSLNVRSAKGLEIVNRLIAISDIVIENFSSRAPGCCKSGVSAMRSCAKSNRILCMCRCQVTAIQVGITITPLSVLSPQRRFAVLVTSGRSRPMPAPPSRFPAGDL